MFPGCGGTSEEERERLKKVERLLSVTDLVMLDIKHMDAEEHRKLTGQDLSLIHILCQRHGV